MRKLLYGLFGLAALGLGSVASQPAEAQSFYFGFGPPAYDVQYRYERPYDYDRRYYGPRPYPRYYRPYPPAYRPPSYRPRCFWRTRQIWNGYRWVVRREQVCRYWR